MPTPDDMTPAWFDQVLGKAGVTDGATVTAANLAPVGGGVIARMVRAELTYDRAGAGPSSVVVKYPTDDPGSLAVAQAMGLYELEVRFYQDLAPLLPDLSAPRCFHAELTDPANFVLVLEDLSGRTRPGDVLTGCTVDECASVLAQLVHFQAPLWNAPVLSASSWLDPARTHGVFDAMSQGVQVFLDRFGPGLDAEHITLFEKVLPRAGEWARSWQAPMVLQHGDFRPDNAMFGVADDAPDVTLIDFQAVRVAPPGLDPAHFLASALGVEDRRANERDLVRDYHAGLVAAGVEGFDFDDCWRSYREGALYAVCLFVGMAGGVESNERNDRLILGASRAYADMAVDLESVEVAFP